MAMDMQGLRAGTVILIPGTQAGMVIPTPFILVMVAMVITSLLVVI